MQDLRQFGFHPASLACGQYNGCHGCRYAGFCSHFNNSSLRQRLLRSMVAPARLPQCKQATNSIYFTVSFNAVTLITKMVTKWRDERIHAWIIRKLRFRPYWLLLSRCIFRFAHGTMLLQYWRFWRLPLLVWCLLKKYFWVLAIPRSSRL